MYCFESWERNTLSILSSWNKTLLTHLFQITLLIITSLLLRSWRDFSIYVLLKSYDIILVLSPQILSFSVSTCILCKRYLLWICMTFSLFFIAMIVLPDVWLTFLTKKNSERIERRHKPHHLRLSSAHILHICRHQSIYLLLGVFKMFLNAFMIKRLRRFWKHLFYSLCRRDFTQIVFTFYPDDLASILIPMVFPLLVAGVYIVKYCLETSRQLKWLESMMACHDYMSKHVTGTTHVFFRSTSDI